MLPLNLVEYHLGEKNHLPSGWHIAKLQTAIITLSLAGFLYEPPAEQHGHTESQKALNVVGTCYTAVFMCYVATDIFIKEHIGKQHVPEELADVIEPGLTLEEYVRQNWIIGGLAFLSAIPYATTAIAYPFDPLGLFVLYLIYIAIATTLLHVLPVKLTLEHPIYGAPPRWCQSLWRSITCHPITEEKQRALDKRNALNGKRQHLAGKVSNAKDHFLASLVPSLGQIDENKLAAYLTISNQEKLNYLMRFDLPTPQLPEIPTYIARFIGVMIELGASLGYAANPYLVIKDWVGFWWLAAIIVAPSLYLFGVLMAFFGDLFGLKILTDLGVWGENVVKLPIEFRVYPKLMLSAIVVNLFCMVYAAAAAQEMMERAFSSKVSPEVMEFLNVIAQIGISILAWYGPLDFQKLIIKYIAQYTQSNASGKIMELTSRLEALESDILRLKENEFTDCEISDEKIINRYDAESEKEKPDSLRGWCCFPWQKQSSSVNQLNRALLK